ncbi:hypothetical protein KJ575_00330 [Patescibacteria group bacterium]|nr:hypothetical protein [Patescibacteria group bacterium]
MKRSVLILTLALAFALAPLITLAAEPGIPHQFYGSVNYSDGSAVSSGTVKAKIKNGVVVTTSSITNGQYGYNPNLFFVTDPNGDRTGTIISFFVNDIDTGKSTVFANKGYTKLDLSIAAIVSSAPASGVGGGGGGGGGVQPASTSTPSPTPTPTPLPTLSPAAQKVDANKDSKIDILDFNILMVNWGKTGTGNVADFNGDGKADIFDFNLLMINWTK